MAGSSVSISIRVCCFPCGGGGMVSSRIRQEVDLERGLMDRLSSSAGINPTCARRERRATVAKETNPIHWSYLRCRCVLYNAEVLRTNTFSERVYGGYHFPFLLRLEQLRLQQLVGLFGWGEGANNDAGSYEDGYCFCPPSPASGPSIPYNRTATALGRVLRVKARKASE